MTKPAKPSDPASIPEDATIVIADAAPTASAGMVLEGPGTRVVDDAYRRLGWIAAIGVGVFVVTMLLLLGVHFLMSGNIVVTWADIIWTAIALVGAASVLFVCQRGMLPHSWFVPVAITFELFMAIMFSSGLLGWQERVANAGLAWLETSSRPPWFLGAGEVPWVAVWMVLFATLVPLKPRQHLWGAFGASLTIVVFPFLSLWLYGVPEVLAPRFGEVFFRVMAFLLLPTLLGMGMAYYAARRISGLRQDLSRAQEMGSYHMVEKLGEGGMGEVWKAEHRMLARPA